MSSWTPDDTSTILAYDRDAAVYAEHSRDRSGLKRLRDRLLGYLPATAEILDLGSGPGHDSALLAAAGAHVVALDPARRLLGEARSYESIAGCLVCGDTRHLPFRDERFDGVWSCASLLHVPHAQVALALEEVLRVLRPGGVAFFSISEGDPAAVVPVTDLGLATRAYYYHRADAWVSMLEGIGFELLDHRLNRESGNFNPGSNGWIETCAGRPAGGR